MRCCRARTRAVRLVDTAHGGKFPPFVFSLAMISAQKFHLEFPREHRKRIAKSNVSHRILDRPKREPWEIQGFATFCPGPCQPQWAAVRGLNPESDSPESA